MRLPHWWSSLDTLYFGSDEAFYRLQTDFSSPSHCCPKWHCWCVFVPDWAPTLRRRKKADGGKSNAMCVISIAVKIYYTNAWWILCINLQCHTSWLGLFTCMFGLLVEYGEAGNSIAFLRGQSCQLSIDSLNAWEVLTIWKFHAAVKWWCGLLVIKGNNGGMSIMSYTHPQSHG